MISRPDKSVKTNHRFLDEAGDTTFYSKGKIPIIGNPGVSCCFILGLVKFRQPLEHIRSQVKSLQQQVQNDPYYREVPSIQKRINKDGFYFHATDDSAEVRKTFFEFIKSLDCSFEAVVGRKIPLLYEKKHNGNETELYADLLSHLIKNKFQKDELLVLTIAQRGKSTRNAVLELAREKAEKIFKKSREGKALKAKIVFNVQNHFSEPLLNVADYYCWALQRVFERGEMRYYHFLQDKIPVIMDLYDQEKHEGWKNYYSPKNPLTAENKISPPLH
jgi:hypothetical protein